MYAGMQTKMSLNSKITSIKFSTVERSLNVFLLFFLALLLTEITLSTVLSLFLGIEYKYEEEMNPEVIDIFTAKFIFLKKNLFVIIVEYVEQEL